MSELLMPAGSLMKLKTAILYGADAVYAGTPEMSLRTKSEFSLTDLMEGIRFAHDREKRVYLTLNLFSHNSDVEKLPDFLATIREIKPDGLIISDPGIFQYVKKNAPELELHVSTQASVCSWLTVDYWKQQGASLCVMARELSFKELKEIREKCSDIRLETFIHGSMCMTYSGRCLLSNYMAERRSNSGNCAHSCRWNYKLRVQLKDGTLQEIELNDSNKNLFEFLLEEEFRPGQLFPIEEDEHGSYILNSKDLCLMPKLNEYLALGIDSLKVEGRHKTNYYVAIVARAYRKAIDDWYRDPDSWSPEPYLLELQAVQNRGYTLAFHHGRLTNLAHNFESSKSVSPHEFAGYIREWQGEDMIFEIKNEILPGDLIEFLSPVTPTPIRMRLQHFTDALTGEITEKVSAGQSKAIRIHHSLFTGIARNEEMGSSSDSVQTILPPLTVARKTKYISPGEQSRFLLDLETQAAEIQSLFVPEERKQALLEDIRFFREHALSLKVRKGPKMGSEGCCGKGCNGCLIFWHPVQKA